MAHSAGSVLHQKWWKFRCSYSQVILLKCSLIYIRQGWQLSYIHLETGTFFFSIERQYDWNRVYVWKSTVAKRLFPHQLLMKGGAAAQRSPDLQQQFILKRSWEEVQRCAFSCCMLICHLMGCALHVTDLYYAPMKKSFFSFLRQEISTTTPAVHDAAGVIRCSQKERRCICKVSKSFTLLQEVYFFLLSALFRHFLKKNDDPNDFKMSNV